MKNNIYILSLFIVSAFFFLGCDENDIAPTIDESAKPKVSITAQSTSISESGSPIFTFTINLDRPIKSTTGFTATQIGGDATDEDFAVSNATIPAYATSVDMEVSIFDDITVEGTETVELQIAPNNVSDTYEVLGTPTISFSIENSTSDDFIFRMDWDGTYADSDGDEHSFCDYDFDLQVFNSDFSEKVSGAETGSCPEIDVISSGALADGDYWLVVLFYTNSGAVPPADTLDIPFSLTFAKPGVSLETINLSGLYDTTSGGDIQGNSDALLIRYVLTVSGNNYTVTDDDTGTVIFQG